MNGARAGFIPIRVVLDGDNKTVLTGSIQVIPGDQTPTVGTTANATHTEQYDYQGAMMFCVLVIGVYAVSIVLLIASFVKKKQVQVSLEETKNVNQYLIQVPDLKEKTARENFRKLKRSIIEAVEKNNKQTLRDAEMKQLGLNTKENAAFRHAILGAGLSLYSPLIVIKEEEEGSPQSPSSHVVNVHDSPSCSSPGSLYPPSDSVTPESPSAGNDRRPLLNITTSPTTSPPTSTPVTPEEDVWQAQGRPRLLNQPPVTPLVYYKPRSPDTRSMSARPGPPGYNPSLQNTRCEASYLGPPESRAMNPVPPGRLSQLSASSDTWDPGPGYGNPSFQRSPSPRSPRRVTISDKQRSADSEIWIPQTVPQTLRTRTPSPQRGPPPKTSQDNAVSSV